MSSSTSTSEKEISSHSKEVLEEVNKHVKAVLDILNRETSRTRKEMDALDEAAKKLEHVHFSEMMKLNVGGHLFSTSLATLKKDPGSMLHAMFSGRFDTNPSEDGSYFIDRDGTHFRYILNYLRNGQLIVPKEDMARIREELLAEAEFYQVEGIIEVLKARAVSMFKDSVILSSDQRETLVTWLKESGAIINDSDKLLYRASRNGWAASNFHSCCDDKGPTVTVIKSGNYIFGGYTDGSWHGSGSFRNAPGSFLFSLVNPSGLPPTKMSLIAGKEGHAIYCTSSFGPIFGGGSFHDFYISNQPNSNNCEVNLNNSYQCPTGQSANTFLTGNQNFRVNEMEVFGFDK